MNTGFDLPNPTNNVGYNQYNSINPITNEIPHNEIENNKFTNQYTEYVPKYFKVSGKYNDVYTAKYYSKYQKYNVIAYKDKYQNVPYYVVSIYSFSSLF